MKRLCFNQIAYFILSSVLFVSLLGSSIQIHKVEAFTYPSYVDSIDTTDCFLDMYIDARKVFHSRLNRSTMFLVGWNVSDDTYIQGIERYCVGEYIASTVIAYELTSNETYLAEAKWLVDQYLLHEGEGIHYKYTWSLYERTPTSNYGWLNHDVMVWWTMQKLNEHGYNYNVTGRVDEAVNVAYYNNETDLAWEYYYWQRTGYPANYVVNTFVPMLFIMSYLTNKNVKDYTVDVQRIYNAAEKFRLANHKYKYKWTDTGWNNEYCLLMMRYYFLGKKYLPNIFNNTKIQQTLEAYTYSDIYEAKTLGRAGAVAVLASTVGFTISDPFKRVLRLLIDQYHNVFSEFYMFDNLIDYSKYYGGIWAHAFMTSLGLSAGTNITFPPISQQVSNNFIYFNTVLRNITPIYTSPSYAGYPVIAPGYVSSRTHAPVSATFGTAIHFNETINAWQRNETWTYDGCNLTFYWGKYAKNFNWTATGKVRWRIAEFQSISAYPLSFIFSNGTLVSITSSNTTLVLDEVFAIEVRYTDKRAYWLLFKTDNASVTQYTYGPTTRMYLWSYISLFNHWRIDESPYLDNANDWKTVHTYIMESLQRIENDLCPTKQESISPKVIGRIIHSDANISNYNDQILTLNKLSFTLLSLGMSKTYVFCGDKGQPTIISGATSWTYNDNSRIATITVEPSVERDVVFYWSSTSSDINGDGVVNVIDLTIVSLSYGNFEGEPDYNPDADLNKDGIVDMRDLATVARHLGETTT